MNVRSIVTLCLIITFAFSQTTLAETEAFLCIPEIPGGTADTRNPDCIDIKSLSVDFSLDATYSMGTGGTLGPPSISPFSIVKSYDVATVGLTAAVVTAKHFQDVFIRFFEKCDQCESPENPYLVYKLSEVIVTRHNVSYFDGGAAISEIVDLSFGKISICAVNNEQEGAPCNEEFAWNLRSNTSE